ncbi:MAG TPA: ATP-binding protein [Anaerolineales bacterium]|nr:ATP-binding protein [Anaerolineales bacterium]
MTTKPTGINCPQCGTPINPSARFCSGCGIDISVITLVLEHSAASALEAHAAPYVPDVLVPRLGEFLINRNLITEDQLQQALKFQKEQAAHSAGKMLGETLIEMGMIARPDLERAIVAQVLDLQTALQASNRQLEERVARRTAELEEALKKVNEVNHLKVDFVSNISHELRTPLAQIKGYVVMMNEGMLGELQPEQADAVQATVAAAERLEHLIEDLIRFASAARGELVLNSSVFSLSDLVKSMVNRAAAKTKKSDLQLKSDIPDQPVFVRGDVEKLSWVLLQLIDNAIKFTSGGGSVTLSVKPKPDGRYVTVIVQDTGIGIPPDRIPELFQPFHQLDGSSTRRYGGTGLGLALVHRIVEAHDSRIRVESAVGKGSTFSFELPAANPA